MEQNMKKRAISFIIAASLVAVTACTQASETSADIISMPDAKIIYEGQEIEFDTAPVNIDGTILVPMRAVFEALGAKVKWDGETQSVEAKKKSKTYNLTLGKAEITESKNGEVTESVTAEQAPQLVNDSTMIPLRALGELFGLEVEWDGETQTVTLTEPVDENSDEWKNNTGDIDLDSMSVTGNGISVDGNVISITAGGDFTVEGSCEDGQVVVDTDEKVKLRLNGMSLTNSSGAPIYVKSADKFYITIEDGTENTLTDGGEYTEELEVNACLYSEDNIEIKGGGILNINGNVHHGISAKDSLEIEDGIINITSAGDGIRVNDTAEMSGGEINIVSEADGIQAEEILDITGGTINIKCNGEVTVTAEYEFGGRGMDGSQQQSAAYVNDEEDSEDISSKGLKAGWMMDISGGNITVNSNDTCIKCDSELNITGGELELYSESKKGIKGMEDVNIDDGVINITKSSEGIESKRILTINGGDIDIIATDDGFNAGGTGQGPMGGGMGGGRGMQPGNMDGSIPDGVGFGAEGQTGGRMRPDSMDGTALAGEQGTEQWNGTEMQPDRGGFGGGRPGSTEISAEHHIAINGGDIYINAEGDGIDSNGSIVISGGNIVIDGPSMSGDSALDHDGLFEINGGLLIGVGSSGMVETPSETSQQNVISAYMQSNIPAGTEITVKDESGSEIMSYTVSKQVGHLMFSSGELETGKTYYVYAGDEEQGNAVIESSITTIGSRMSGGFGGMGGQRGGRGMQPDAAAESPQR